MREPDYLDWLHCPGYPEGPLQVEPPGRPASQAKLESAIEALASLAVGITASLLLNQFVLPVFWDYHPTIAENATMTGIFTISSLIRSYYVRRFFDRWGTRFVRYVLTCI